MKKAFKLLRVRKDGSLGPLFINCRQRIETGKWLRAENHPTEGYAVRPGWHVTASANAPHLSMNGRKWMQVEIKSFKEIKRPKSQGGLWYLAQWMRVVG
jgi:hypothetical protein